MICTIIFLIYIYLLIEPNFLIFMHIYNLYSLQCSVRTVCCLARPVYPIAVEPNLTFVKILQHFVCYLFYLLCVFDSVNAFGKTLLRAKFVCLTQTLTRLIDCQRRGSLCVFVGAGIGRIDKLLPLALAGSVVERFLMALLE